MFAVAEFPIYNGSAMLPRQAKQTLAILILAVLSLSGQTQTPQSIQISAKRYAFDPPSITLKKGVPVVLVLSSTDTTHGLQIKELGINTKIPKGETVRVPLTPDRTGTFQGKCSVFCGFGHGRMTMKVTVTD